MKHLMQFATVVAMLSLAGCSTETETEPETPKEQPEAPKERKGKKSPKTEPAPKARSICMGKKGDMAVDIRVVIEGGKVVGGMLSFVDSENGMSGTVEPLEGTREGKVMNVEGTGQIEGEKQTVTAVITQTKKGSAKLKLNGTDIDGILDVSGCKGD